MAVRVSDELVITARWKDMGVSRGTRQHERDLQRLSQTVDRTTGTLMRFAGTLGVAFSVRELGRTADAWTQLTNRIQLFTDSEEETLRVQKELFDVSQRTRTVLPETVQLYQRMAQNSDQLGLSQERLIGITETINKTLVISGASATSAQAALVQLGQAFAADALRGQELNSVMEQAPRLAKAISEGLGIPIGKLREMGAAGELTATQVIQAIESQSRAIDSEFGKIDSTIGQATTKVGNSFTRLIGKMDDTLGVSDALVDQFDDLTHSLDQGAEQGNALVSSLDHLIQFYRNNEDAFDALAMIVGGGLLAGGAGRLLMRNAVPLAIAGGAVAVAQTSRDGTALEDFLTNLATKTTGGAVLGAGIGTAVGPLGTGAGALVGGGAGAFQATVDASLRFLDDNPDFVIFRGSRGENVWFDLRARDLTGATDSFLSQGDIMSGGRTGSRTGITPQEIADLNKGSLDPGLSKRDIEALVGYETAFRNMQRQDALRRGDDVTNQSLALDLDNDKLFQRGLRDDDRAESADLDVLDNLFRQKEDLRRQQADLEIQELQSQGKDKLALEVQYQEELQRIQFDHGEQMRELNVNGTDAQKEAARGLLRTRLELAGQTVALAENERDLARKRQRMFAALAGVNSTLSRIEPNLNNFGNALIQLLDGDELGAFVSGVQGVLDVLGIARNEHQAYEREILRVARAMSSAARSAIDAVRDLPGGNEELTTLQHQAVKPLLDAFGEFQALALQANPGATLLDQVRAFVESVNAVDQSLPAPKSLLELAGAETIFDDIVIQLLGKIQTNLGDLGDIDAKGDDVGELEKSLQLVFGPDSTISEIVPRIFSIRDAFEDLGSSADRIAGKLATVRDHFDLQRVSLLSQAGTQFRQAGQDTIQRADIFSRLTQSLDAVARAQQADERRARLGAPIGADASTAAAKSVVPSGGGNPVAADVSIGESGKYVVQGGDLVTIDKMKIDDWSDILDFPVLPNPLSDITVNTGGDRDLIRLQKYPIRVWSDLLNFPALPNPLSAITVNADGDRNLIRIDRFKVDDWSDLLNFPSLPEVLGAITINTGGDRDLIRIDKLTIDSWDQIISLTGSESGQDLPSPLRTIGADDLFDLGDLSVNLSANNIFDWDTEEKLDVGIWDILDFHSSDLLRAAYQWRSPVFTLQPDRIFQWGDSKLKPKFENVVDMSDFWPSFGRFVDERIRRSSRDFRVQSGYTTGRQ